MVWNFQSNKRAQTQETNKPTFSGQNRQKIASVLFSISSTGKILPLAKG